MMCLGTVIFEVEWSKKHDHDVNFQKILRVLIFWGNFDSMNIQKLVINFLLVVDQNELQYF